MKKTLPLKFLVSVLTVAIVSLLLWPGAASAAPNRVNTITRKATVMGTNLEVTFSGLDNRRADKAFAVIVKEFKRIERELSEWRGETYVVKINKNAGKAPVAVPSELFMIIKAADMVSCLSNGAFDITWASMWGLWDFS